MEVCLLPSDVFMDEAKPLFLEIRVYKHPFGNVFRQMEVRDFLYQNSFFPMGVINFQFGILFPQHGYSQLTHIEIIFFEIFFKKAMLVNDFVIN
jgi:hypothetical protein